MEKMETKVMFLFNEKNQDLYAVFPEEYADMRGSMTCYSHIGQHSGCSQEYIDESRPATEEEYERLLGELISIGYKLIITEKCEY